MSSALSVKSVDRKILQPRVWMDHGDKAHETADGTPKEVHGAIAQRHALFAIDGAVRRSEGGGIIPQVLEAVLASVAPWPAASTRGRCRHGFISHRVGLDGGDELVAGLEQGADNLARGIVGVGDQVTRQ